jgi:hypothetical protein
MRTTITIYGWARLLKAQQLFIINAASTATSQQSANQKSQHFKETKQQL